MLYDEYLPKDSDLLFLDPRVGSWEENVQSLINITTLDIKNRVTNNNKYAS